ncbi:hypothetical protein [Amycolatopsis thermoflava]|uniref:hypothetical protein n=1 Tax=Amycolatopsis thermoflava TaxID=84480 RepID=UPI003EB806A8
MTNAQPISRPSAAHSAKNATAPGLPNQSRNDSKGRTPMVGKARTLVSTTAAELAEGIDDELVTYTPHALNELISAVAAREVAGRLRERAAWHRERATTWAWVTANSDDPCVLWHEREAKALDRLAGRELESVERGEAR